MRSKIVIAWICIVALLMWQEEAVGFTDGTIRICGGALTHFMENYCDRFNTKFKRSGGLAPETDVMLFESGDNDDGQFGSNTPFMNKIYAEYENMLLTRRRQQRDIVDECCHKQCKYSELRAYCYGSAMK